jgi:hypothetical protein
MGYSGFPFFSMNNINFRLFWFARAWWGEARLAAVMSGMVPRGMELPALQ